MQEGVERFGLTHLFDLCKRRIYLKVMYIERAITPTLHALANTPLGRCLVLTGARQTGKTTLLQHEFGRDYEYFSFDEPFARAGLTRLSAADWLARGRRYIFDEVQKAPDFMGTVKAMLDSGPQDLRLLLSGSAQIHLLSSIRESLAGRSVTRELYPLSVSELAGIDKPLIKDILSELTPIVKTKICLVFGAYQDPV